MKQVFAFLLLFGAGLTLLIWLERRSAPEEPPGGPENAPTTTEPGVGVGEEPGPPAGEGAEPSEPGGETTGAEEPPAPQVAIGGEFGFSWWDRHLTLKSEDSRTTGDVDELDRVEATVRGPVDDEVQAELQAASASVRRIEVSPLEISYEPRIELRDVRVDLLDGVPVVPLFVRTGAAELDATDPRERLLRSDEQVTFESEALNGAGRGLLLRFRETEGDASGGGFLLLEHDGWLEFEDLADAEARGARIASTGELRLVRAPAARDPSLTITATDEAELVLARGSRLVADEISLRGHDQGRSTLVPERVEAVGDVRWRDGLRVFRGERGYVEFDAEGEPVRVVLEGLPSFRASLEEDGGAAAEPQVVSGRGEGPLVLTMGAEDRFELAGPAEIEVPGGTLRSAGAVSGAITEDLVRLFAGGGVELEGRGAQLQTAELRVEIQGRGPTARVGLIAESGARLEGNLADGSRFVLTTPAQLEVERAEGRWRVVDAEQVVTSIEGDDTFTARARRVWDFDLEEQSLHAEGDVSFQTEQGTGTGERLQVFGKARGFTLDGTAEELARFENDQGVVRARRFVGDGERIVAQGAVDARISLHADAEAGPLYELTCDEMEVQRTDTREEADGGRTDRFRVRARGDVKGTLTDQEGSTRISARWLDGERTERRDADDNVVEARSRLELDGEVDAGLERDDQKLELDAEHVVVTRTLGAEGAAERVEARGDVRFEIDTPGRAVNEQGERQLVHLEGEGESLLLGPGNEGRLEPVPGGRVRVDGSLPGAESPYRLTAELFLFFADERFEALRPTIRFVRGQGGDQAPQTVRADAARLVADADGLHFIDDVVVRSNTPSGVPWYLTTDGMRFSLSETEVRSMEAHGSVRFEVGAQEDGVGVEPFARAVGDSLLADTALGSLRLEGAPARIETQVVEFEAEWIEFDPDLRIVTATGPGKMRPVTEQAADGGPRWTLEYLGSRTLIEPDHLVYVLEQPLFVERENDSLLRACWAVFWLDRRKWLELPGKLASGEITPEELAFVGGDVADSGQQGENRARLFGLFETTAFAGLLRETYFEGPVEIEQDGELLARSDAIFLDVVDGHGWLANATMTVNSSELGSDSRVTIHADWLRHSKDGSLRADSATLTPCDYAVPHMKIVTGDLRIEPLTRPDSKGRTKRYWAELHDNRIEFYKLFRLPLPDFGTPLDEEFKPDFGDFRFGDSARFGAFVSASLTRDAGKVGKTVNQILDGSPVDYDADFKLDASWLGSRGLLLDGGLDLESKGRYWFDFRVGGLPDGGEDRGAIRVPEGDRERLRLWYRARSRHLIDDEQWIDFAFSHQTDPGVLSEFFEDEFERYEQRENFLQWRLGRDGNYYSAAAEARVDGFRTEIEELPSLRAYRGRWPFASLGGVPLLHTAEARVEFLRRVEGDLLTGQPEIDSTLFSPFALPAKFPDGNGERDLLRFDLRERVEAPMELGAAGLRLTPFIGARMTFWDEGVDRDNAPTRFIADAGLRLATTFWQRTKSGKLNSITPFVELKDDFVNEAQGDPLRSDVVDDSSAGTFVDIGARSRWSVDERGKALLDLDLRLRHSAGVEERAGITLPEDRDNGWSSAVYGRLNLEAFGVPVQVSHDGRYALDDNDERTTLYAGTRLAVRPTEDLRFEGGHRRGLISPEGLTRDPLFPDPDLITRSFESASVSGIYSWTDKWEFEARQVFSLRTNANFNTDFIIRRFGHDVVFEVGSSVRDGEGASISFSFKPRFGWNPSDIGYLNF